MKAEFTVLNSAYKYISNSAPLPETDSGVLGKLSVFKNEEFGIQLLIKADREFIAIKGRHMDICWKGLIDKIRVEIEVVDTNYVKIPPEEQPSERLFSMNLVDYVMDDDGNLVSDILLKSSTRHAMTMDQVIYISGKIPKNFETQELGLTIRAFYSEGYEDENLIFESTVDIEVMDYVLDDIKDSKFYMDLWQHPCNWARAYDADYYSKEHMQIIDNYMQAMSLIGQRVCDLIISDYPWAGQRCYKVEDNHENLFELNIITLTKNIEGNIECDFTAMDRYLEIAKKHGMAKEINLFGILGNWDGFDFENPLSEFKDPIRVSYFDKRSKTFKYINNKEELKSYLKQVFAHINDLGIWDKTLIMSDEPDNVELFQESVELFKEASQGLEIKIKCAIHNQKFFENYGENIKSISLNTCELVNNTEKIDEIKSKIQKKDGKFTWFSCCFPSQMNIYLKSPLIESRLMGWFTYYMNLDGFLRWAYGIWPGNVMHNASYKKEKWAAGDMYFVYPGKDGKPMDSLRLKNLVYGIQDWIVLSCAEKNMGRESLEKEMKKLLGKKED
ncbi:MAG: glycoside hydrolase domain-containing protein, partial [Proteocatella sp.]